jgi:hypothetical protein
MFMTMQAWIALRLAQRAEFPLNPKQPQTKATRTRMIAARVLGFIN